MSPQEQAAADRAEQVRLAEEQTRKALEDLQRHGESAGAVNQIGAR
ncbi:hypothetical protein ACFPK5_00385 [Streptomyces beijiangensis]